MCGCTFELTFHLCAGLDLVSGFLVKYCDAVLKSLPDIQTFISLHQRLQQCRQKQPQQQPQEQPQEQERVGGGEAGRDRRPALKMEDRIKDDGE